MNLNFSRKDGTVTIKGDRRSLMLLGEAIQRLVNQPYYPHRKTEREIDAQTLSGQPFALKLEILEDTTHAMPKLQ